MAEQAVCSVSSKITGWNRHIPLVAVQDKSIFRSRLVNRIMYVWQPKTSSGDYMQPQSEILFQRYSSVTERLIRLWFFTGLARARESRAWCILMTLISLSYWLLIAIPWLWKVLREKGKRHENRNIKKMSMQLGPGIFIPCIIRALISVNSRQSQAVMTSLPSLVKGSGKQSH